MRAQAPGNGPAQIGLIFEDEQAHGVRLLQGAGADRRAAPASRHGPVDDLAHSAVSIRTQARRG
ncbi:hypothetical protein GLA29479_3013 [Lysobacter antibioticus]|nr:hypothetical protein GLA29479_3013 [Lysobacter antibioticus]